MFAGFVDIVDGGVCSDLVGVLVGPRSALSQLRSAPTRVSNHDEGVGRLSPSV